MFSNTVLIKAVLVGLLLAALTGAWLHYRSVTKDLAFTKNTLLETQQKFETSQAALAAVTVDKAKFEQQVAAATAERRKIQTNLDATLKKLRNQKPPTECKAAIDWSIQNKGDLAW